VGCESNSDLAVQFPVAKHLKHKCSSNSALWVYLRIAGVFRKYLSGRVNLSIAFCLLSWPGKRLVTLAEIKLCIWGEGSISEIYAFMQSIADYILICLIQTRFHISI
jgi:hypothetical protein